ncbi:unnamed protein product [Paramecium primaurelia]|uniref:Protein kinase domain-containing protein n=1 Tax=Paramecium primaurelia TaxID=5886 RepID=A0A8S1PPL8_PARPR|nr:unnamed protein product [Paramecium primaurelia]
MKGEISFQNNENNQNVMVITYDCESNIQFKGKLEQLTWEKQKKINLKDVNKENICLLEIKSFTNEQVQGNGRQPFTVKYKCDSSAKTLLQILQEEPNKVKKILYFYKLIDLANILKKQKIVHMNLKLYNIIWYKQKFYLINFGYLDTYPSQYVTSLNYGNEQQYETDRQRYLYPYLTQNFLTFIKDNLGNKDLIEKHLKNISEEKKQKYDLYALGIMMLELFVPLEKIYKNFQIQTYDKKTKKYNIIEQLKRIDDCQDIYGKDTCEKIKQILNDIFIEKKLPSEKDYNSIIQIFENIQKQQEELQELQKREGQRENDIGQQQHIQRNSTIIYEENQSFINNSFESRPLLQEQILQQKMNPQHESYVKDLIDKQQIYDFDPKLLYYLNHMDLMDYQNKIKDTPTLDHMKKKGKHLQRLLNMDYLKNKKYNEFSQLDKEDRFYLLQNYLKDKNNQIDTDIQEAIESLNQIPDNQFQFNEIKKNSPIIQLNTEQSFLEKLNRQMPVIKRFIEYQMLFLLNQNDQQFNWKFEDEQEKQINKYQMICAKVKVLDKNEIWYFFDLERMENAQLNQEITQLHIGNIEDNQFKGRIIEYIPKVSKNVNPKKKGLIVDYEEVEVNLHDMFKKGENVKITTYKQNNFEKISVYTGNLKNNEYHGEGKIIDLQNNYYYYGEWKNGKKDGKGEFKVLSTEFQYKYEFKELKGIFSDDHIEQGSKIKFFPNLKFQPNTLSPNQNYEEGSGNFYFEEAVKVYYYKDKYRVKIESSQLYKAIQNKLKNLCCNLSNLCKKQ